MGEPRRAHFRPPQQDAAGRELGRIMVDSDANPALVVEHIVNAVGDCLAQVLVLEVMHADLLRVVFRPPLPPGVLEIAPPTPSSWCPLRLLAGRNVGSDAPDR